MPHLFTESQWKRFRKLRSTALERYCRRALKEMEYISSDKERSWHQRYLDVYKRLHERDDELARAFDEIGRSKALLQLVQMMKLDLLSEAEFGQFSREIQEAVQQYLSAADNQ